MNGSIPIVQVVFGALIIVGLVAMLGFCCSLLCLHALGGVKTRMVTNDKLEAFKGDFQRIIERKLEDGLRDQTSAIGELRADLATSREAVVSIQTSNNSVAKTVELMSHNLMRIHEKHVDRLLDQLQKEQKPLPLPPSLEEPSVQTA